MAEVDDTTHCQVCFEAYEETGKHVPRILPCFHSVCEDCIKKLMKENNLDCPECRAKHPAANGFLSFPQNKYIISNVKRNAQFPTCDIHNRVMTLFCNETNCRVPICSRCLINDHKNHGMKDFKEEYKETHDVLSLDLNSLKSNLQCKREEFMIKRYLERRLKTV